jgi:hypothetical protein
MGNNPVGNVDPMGTWLYAKTKPAVVYAKGKLMGLGLRVAVVKTGYGYMLDVKSVNSKQDLARAEDKASWWSGTSKMLSIALDNEANYFIDSDGGYEKQTQIDLGAIASSAYEGYEGGAIVVANTLSFGYIHEKEYKRHMARQGALLKESVACAKTGRGALMVAGGAALAGVGGTAMTVEGVTIAANSQAGAFFFSATAFGGVVGASKWDEGGDFGDVMDMAGGAALVSGAMLRATGQHYQPSSSSTAPISPNRRNDKDLIPLKNNSVRKLLKSRGLTKQQAKDVVNSFKGQIYVRQGAAGDRFVVTESSTGQASGIFVTRGSAGSTPELRAQRLALPPSNSAAVESPVRLTRPQLLIEGKVAPQPQWGEDRTGGEWQVVTNGGRYTGAVE